MNHRVSPSTSAVAAYKNQLRRCGLVAALMATAILAACRGDEQRLATPLAVAGYSRLSTSAEISTYMQQLAREYPQARVETFGVTVQGRPLEALVLSAAPDADAAVSDRLTILIVGGQHGGSEPGSPESLLFIARDLVAGNLRPVLEDVDVVLVPNANPDGLDAGRRPNANEVNLSTDFVALTQPESRALVAALERYRPEVVLDVHESAVLKRKSLGLEGYMTDFVTQFEMANNPSVVPALRDFAMAEVLTPWIAAVNDAGLRSHRYFSEIRSARQPITNGGLTFNNLRNRVGIEGVLSFLMETRLDPRDGEYPTYRNIGRRVEIQRISIERFLTLLDGKRAEVLAAVAAARKEAASAPLVLHAQYAPAPGNPRISIDLRRIADGALEPIEFVDHRSVVTSDPLPMPAAYVVRAHQAELGALLDRQGIAYRTLDAPRTDEGVEFETKAAAQTPDEWLENVHERTVRIGAQPGDLWIDLAQPRGRLAAVLLEPRSTSSLWLKPEYFSLLSSEKTLPIYRIPRSTAELPRPPL